ncbi:MAG: carboxypeptidase-like regulatory domain-containing protein [Cyanobacteria bacterium J06642_3]
MGRFDNWGGGVNYRRGITPQLTLGTGLVVDDSLLAMGELFYQPNNVPLQLGLSTLIAPQLKNSEYTAYFNYQPTKKLNLNFNGNGSGHNLLLNWRASPGFSFRLGSDHRDNIATGITLRHHSWLKRGENKQQFSLLTSLDYGDRQGWKQIVDSRYSIWGFSHQGDRDATFSRLSYYLTNNAFKRQGQSLFLGYDTRKDEGLVNLGWHYRSSQDASDGGSLWDLELGYGFNNQASAPLAALTTRAIAGTTLRLSYEGISPGDNDAQVRIDLFPNLRLQGRASLGDRHLTKLRTQGGLLVRPFGDLNTNGKLDKGEQIYTEDAELLLTINHKFLASMPQDITQQGVYVPLAPGEYRLDLNPAGLPFNFQPQQSNYGVQVAAGSYTELDLPLNRSYTAIGTVTNSEGEPVAGVRVQAVSQNSQSILSITNSAGVYFLEGLTQDTYRITINDQAVDVKPLRITADSEPLQEINLKY